MVAIPSSLDEPVHPGFEEPHSAKAWKPADGVVDLSGRGTALLVTEEVAGHEAKLVLGLNPATHRAPEAVHQEAHDPGDGGALKPDLRLAIVEEEVPRLVALDVVQQPREH